MALLQDGVCELEQLVPELTVDRTDISDSVSRRSESRSASPCLAASAEGAGFIAVQGG